MAALRRKFGVTVQGANVPNPVTTFEEGSFPGAAAPPHARKCKCTRVHARRNCTSLAQTHVFTQTRTQRNAQTQHPTRAHSCHVNGSLALSTVQLAS